MSTSRSLGVPNKDAKRCATRPHIAIVGGGYAGLAAAVTLVDAAIRVTLFEAGNELGGRARRITTRGMVFDNGQHLLLGAYETTLKLIAKVHEQGIETLFIRTPLALQSIDGMRFVFPRLGAPLHLLMALLRARGFTLRERASLLRWFRRQQRSGFTLGRDMSVSQLLAEEPRAIVETLWTPICLAALNTPPESASARVFLNVLGVALNGRARDSDFLHPAVDLTTLFPQVAARYVTIRGGRVLNRTAVKYIELTPGGVEVTTQRSCEHFDAIVFAVAPRQFVKLAATIPECTAAVDSLSRFSYQPIYTVYCQYPRPLRLPRVMLRLDDEPSQWIFDREQLGGPAGLAACIISARGPHQMLGHDTLLQRVSLQLQRLYPQWGTPLKGCVIAEKHATHACVANLPEISAGRICDRVYVCGDFTHARLPGTLEAATRSGVAAAIALLETPH